MKNKKIKNIIKEIVNEVMDSTAIPDNYEKNGNLITFVLGDFTYWVRFTPFQVATNIFVHDINILNIINNAKRKYIVAFGIINEKGEEVYNLSTNANNSIEVMKFVNGIILEFVQDEQVEILTYIPNSAKRDRVFKLIAKNILSNYFEYYKAKNIPDYNAYLIAKKFFRDGYDEY